MENNDFIIENGVLKKYIGNSAEVTIPDGVIEIGEYAFYNCEKLKKINIPNKVEKIGFWSFRHTGLTSVTIPNSVKKVDFAAFACCKNLRNVKILNDETCIMPDTFCGCPKLADENGFIIVKNVLWDYYGTDSEVTVPSGVRIIDNGLFSGTLSWESNLTSIVLPDSLEIIGWRTFSFCKKLTSVIIPSSVKEICCGAFRYCENLKSVTIVNKDVEIEEKAFAYCENLTIHAPAGSCAEQYAKENNIPFVAI